MTALIPQEPVDYLLIGHIAEDITPAGKALGGTVTFAALTARSLGLRVGIITASRPEVDLEAMHGVQILRLESQVTTTFENIYTENGRVQTLHHQAAPIRYEDMPQAWRNAGIIHLAPIAQELDSNIPASFSASLLGITPQGWMRTWDKDGRVHPCTWESAEIVLPRAGAVVISREDVGGDDELIEQMAHKTRVLAVTEGAAGVVLHWNGDRRRFRAPNVKEVDATGAGDIFAASFFARYHSTRDPWEAARFATQIAARSVTRDGLNGIPTSKEIEESMMEVF